MVSKRINKSRKTSKPKASRSKRVKNMRGGHAGTVMPSEYFGGNSGRYFPVGSDELKPCSRQFARSHGVIHADGRMAGPNLFPKHGGSRKSKSNKSKSNRSKSNRSKSNRSSKRMNKRNQKSKKSRKLLRGGSKSNGGKKLLVI